MISSKVGILFFALVLVSNVASQFLEKKGLSQLPDISSFGQLFTLSTIWKLATNVYVVSGVALSMLGLALWLGALSSLKLSYLAPLTSLTYVVIALLSWAFLGESISLTRWLGIVVIMAGVVLLNR